MLIINTQKETKKQPAPVYQLPLLLPCPYSFLLRFSVHLYIYTISFKSSRLFSI